MAAEKAPDPAVIVTVNGGIADVSASPGVRIVHIDNDSWSDADPAWAARQDLLDEIETLEALPDGAGPSVEASRYNQIVASLDRLADPDLFGSATCPECGGEESCGVPGVNRSGRRCESCDGGYDTHEQAAAAAARVFTAARAGLLSLNRRAGIAMAPRAPADVLEALAADPDPQVRQRAAENPNTPAAARAHAGLLAD